MIKNIKLKNNKGISLSSVVITVIVMLMILTSIIFSQSRSKEIQKAMLVNTDIEELTKKVEVYYLEKGALPIDKSEDYKYIEEGKTADNQTPVYYRLQISLLENVTLSNNEIIDVDAEEKQWYVINPETHTIYFVKYEAGKKVLQEYQYSKNYEKIVDNAVNENIRFNISELSSGGVDVGETTIAPGEDVLLQDPNSVSIRDLYGEEGNSTGPNNPTLDTGTASYTYKDYIGWNMAGTSTTNLVLQYDGEYNSGKTGTYHTETTTTWVDLTGNNNNCTFKNNNFSYKYSAGGLYTAEVDINNFKEDTYLIKFDGSKKEGTNPSYTDLKYDMWSKSSDKNMNFNNKSISLPTEDTNKGHYAKPTLQFSDDYSYTIEMSFYYTGKDTIYFYDFSYLTEATQKKGTYNDGSFLYDFMKVSFFDLENTQLFAAYNTENGIISDWKLGGNGYTNQPISAMGVINITNTDKTKAFNEKNAFLTKLENKLKASNYTRNAYMINSTLYINEGGNSKSFALSELKTNTAHTLTVVYDKSNSKVLVYVDGNIIGDNISKTANFSKRIGLFVKDVVADILYVDQCMSGTFTYSASLGNMYLGSFNAYNRAIFRCKYNNVSTNDFYSVRIYNRSLSNSEIKYNYITDYFRFSSGT